MSRSSAQRAGTQALSFSGRSSAHATPEAWDVLEALPAGVVILDTGGRVAAHNALAREYLGVPLRGERWREVIVRAFRDFGDGEAAPLRDGRHLNIATNPLPDGGGQVLLLRDVTEARAIQALFDRHRRLASMGEMAASLAHQIRTPLASCLLYLSHLERDRLDDSLRRRCVGKMRACLDHLERLVGDMLVFARGEQLGKEEIVVSGLLKDAVRLTRPLVESSGCTLRILDRSGGRCIRGNRDALLGVLQNLIANAIQACAGGHGGCLELEALPGGEAAGDETMRILLRDDGPGMSPEVQARVFEPFFTTKADGTGLGLAVVAAVARAHQGVAWVDSRPGEGATVALELPVSTSTAAGVGTRTKESTDE